ncbi:MAG: radical SAM protein [Cyanobacteria bacterium P01_G01_bin.54]
MVEIHHNEAKSLLNKATGFIDAFDFTLNPYRGCQYACSYCYAAAFSPNATLRQDWGNWVIVKDNAADLLSKELNRWDRKHLDRPPRIYLSSVTDPYQPIESRAQLTRRLLEVMLDRPRPPVLVLQTRSPMLVRDLDLLQRFPHLGINLSITTGSDRIRRDFEPQAPSIPSRLQTLRKIRDRLDPEIGYIPRLTATLTPLLPTDPQDLDSFFAALKMVDRIVIQTLHGNVGKSLIAATREAAIALQERYTDWYADEVQSYRWFREKLISALSQHCEIREGKAGFTYD